jgi:hypothetical protein
MKRNSCCEESVDAHTWPSSGRKTPRISGAINDTVGVLGLSPRRCKSDIYLVLDDFGD